MRWLRNELPASGRGAYRTSSMRFVLDACRSASAFYGGVNRAFVRVSGGCGFPFHWERGPNGTVWDGGSGRCGPLFRGVWDGVRESVSGRECHRCRRAPITGLERCRAEAARVLAAVSCFFVLTKGMSVIGPRPALPSEVKTYTDYQRQRLLLRNGLSCYWQTRRNRDTITFDEWIDLDLCGAMVPDTNHRHSQRHGYRGTGGASHDQYVKNGVLFESHRFFAAPPGSPSALRAVDDAINASSARVRNADVCGFGVPMLPDAENGFWARSGMLRPY